MKRSLLAGLAVVVAATVAAPAIASATPVHKPAPTLAQILLSDSTRDDRNGFDRNPDDFDIVTQALLLFPDLVQAASDPKSNLTVFLPTDYAFRALVKGLTGKVVFKEADVFAAVAGLGAATVKAVLTYHIVPGRIDYATAVKSNGAQLKTLNGATITVHVSGKRFKWVRLQDKDPDLRDPRVVVANIRASNGIAHAINRVLLPINV